MLKLYIGIFLPVTILLPLWAALRAYGRWQAPERMAALYLLADGIGSIVSVSLAKSGINNMPVFHVYTVIEFLLLTLFFARGLEGSLLSRYAGLLMMAFTLFAAADALFIQGIWHFNTYPRTLEALLLVSFALFFLYQRIDGGLGERWTEWPSVWFAMGVLLYFSGALALFLLSDRLAGRGRARDAAWAIHASLQLLLYIFFTVGFRQCRNVDKTTAIYN